MINTPGETKEYRSHGSVTPDPVKRQSAEGPCSGYITGSGRSDDPAKFFFELHLFIGSVRGNRRRIGKISVKDPEKILFVGSLLEQLTQFIRFGRGGFTG